MLTNMARKKKRLEWSPNKDDVNYDGLSELLREYSYRHAHIWRVVVQATAVVVGLGVIPHVEQSNAPQSLHWVPALGALLLAALAFHRLRREFRLFDSVKKPYLKMTGRWDENERETMWHRLIGFRHQVLGYQFLLLVAALANFVHVLKNY